MSAFESLPSTSLIITTYNKPEYLKLALATASRQTFKPREIIVADDGSGEETRDVVREARRNANVPIAHVWQPDEGFRLNRSRNNAIAVATGEYIVLLDGDCFVESHFIEDHARAARKGQYVAATRTHLSNRRRDYILRTGDARVGLLTPGASKRLHTIRSRLLSAIFSETGDANERISPVERRGVAGANLAFWREDALRVNGFDERFEGYGGDDVEFADRLSRSGARRLLLRHLATARHFAHGNRPHEMREIMKKYREWTESNVFRVPDGFGLDRALARGAERIEW